MGWFLPIEFWVGSDGPNLYTGFQLQFPSNFIIRWKKRRHNFCSRVRSPENGAPTDQSSIWFLPKKSDQKFVPDFWIYLVEQKFVNIQGWYFCHLRVATSRLSAKKDALCAQKQTPKKTEAIVFFLFCWWAFWVGIGVCGSGLSLVEGSVSNLPKQEPSAILRHNVNFPRIESTSGESSCWNSCNNGYDNLRCFFWL